MAQYPKFCPNCGTPLEEGYAFCATCGAPIAMLESEEDTDSAFALTPDAINAVLNATKPSGAVPDAATQVMIPDAGASTPTEVMASAGAAPDALTQVIAPGQVEAAAPASAQAGPSVLPSSSEQATQFMPSSQPTSQMPPEHPQQATVAMDPGPAAQQASQPSYGMPTPAGMGFQAPGGTSPMSAVQAAQSPSAQPVSYVQSSAVPQGSDGKRKLLIALVAVLAVIAIVLVFFAVSTALGGKDEPANQTTPTEQNADNDAKPDSDQAPAADEKAAAASEQQTYEVLLDYYNALGDYDKSIGNVASEFNNNWTKSDLSTRQAKEMECDEVYTNLMADISDLQALNVPSTSEYADDYAAIVNLYSDCEHRISVISQAWGIANSYSDPSAHEDEVLAPIAADNVGGKNKYKKDFDDNYSSAKPHAPSA